MKKKCKKEKRRTNEKKEKNREIKNERNKYVREYRIKKDENGERKYCIVQERKKERKKSMWEDFRRK